MLRFHAKFLLGFSSFLVVFNSNYLNFHLASAAGVRSQATRVRTNDQFRSSGMTNLEWLSQQLQDEKEVMDNTIEEELDLIEMEEALQAFNDGLSMTVDDTTSPSISSSPSMTPIPGMLLTDVPSSLPSDAPAIPLATPVPTDPLIPDAGISDVVSGAPSKFPSMMPSTSHIPSSRPSMRPSLSTMPSIYPTSMPSMSSSPSTPPSTGPTLSSAPSVLPSLGFDRDGCNQTPIQRSEAILDILDQNVDDPTLLRDNTTPQGMATEFIIAGDERLICPDDEKILQRWVLAVMYYSTGGDNWTQCSAGNFNDACGFRTPFANGEQRFLSSSNECNWAGISCDFDQCVTEIEFEKNNLVGTLATEIALLPELAVWGMEQGGLEGTIPTEIGQLTNLIFIDFDFNFLTGSLPDGLYDLSLLSQLDLNDNRLTGIIDDRLGVSFPSMKFLQLQNNFFSGEVPQGMGTYNFMTTFNLHNTSITGIMPDSVCDLLDPMIGNLTSLIAECDPPATIICSCCDCRGDP